MNLSQKSIKKQYKKFRSKKVRYRSKAANVMVELIVVTLVFVVVVAGSIGLGAMEGVIDNAPDIDDLNFKPDQYATTIYDSAGNMIQRLVMEGTNREEVTYEELPTNLVNAFIAIEDERFWENNGIDLKAVLRAVKGLLTKDSSAGGGSTITQQLIKNAVFEGGNEKSMGVKLERKLQELYLAIQLNDRMSKELIMTNYLNTINLGKNTLGVKVAARRYFDKEVSELTLSECTVIAGITKNPSRLNPVTGAEDNAARRKIILNNMEEQGMISKAEKEEALADDVYERIQYVDIMKSESTAPYSYFTDEVIEQVKEALINKLGYSDSKAHDLIYGGGLSIHTTQDPVIQAIVDEEINNPANYTAALVSVEYRLSVTHADKTTEHFSENHLKSYHNEVLKDSYSGLYGSEEEALADIERFKQYILKEGDEIIGERIQTALQPQTSFVIMNQATGEVKAISGGRGAKTGSLTLNRATNTLRQPGSTFKVITAFAPAIDLGNANIGTVYYDAAYTVGNKTFKNWYSGFTGFSSIRDGIIYSINIVAVRCMMESISPAIGVEYAQKFGITSLTGTDLNASTALGGITDGVSNLELTASYAAIANGGVYTEPILFTKILDHNGKILLENTPESHVVLKESTAFLLTNAMEEGMQSSRKFGSSNVNSLGVRAKPANISSAGKSGTTSNNKDIWFLGFTPYYTAGIWAGNDSNQVISGGTSFHKDIWKNIMTRVHDGMYDPGFTVPDNMEKVEICRKSGKRAIQGICTADPRGNAVYSEYYEKGTAPIDLCDKHVQANICSGSGLLATAYCPVTASQIFLSVPLEEGATADSAYALPGECNVHNASSVIIPPLPGGEDDIDTPGDFNAPYSPGGPSQVPANPFSPAG